MPKLKFNTFKGIVPVTAPKLKDELNAQTAKNINLDSGRLAPYRTPLFVANMDSYDPLKTFKTPYIWYKADIANPELMLFENDTDVIRSPVAEDQFYRIYMTDGVKPKVMGQNGTGTYEEQHVLKDMEQPTATAPSAVVTDSLLISGSSIDLVSLLKSATASVTGKITAWQITEQIEQVIQLTNPKVTFNSDKSKVYLEYVCPDFWATDNSTAASIPEPPEFQQSFETFMSCFPEMILSLPIPGAGTLENKTPVSITDIGDLSLESFTGLRIIVGNNHNWGGATPAVSYWYGRWGGNDTVKITLNVAYTAEAASKINSSISKTVSVPDKFVYYVQTLLNEWNMEGPPSPVSNEVGLLNGQSVKLSNFGDAQGAVTRRFYRSTAGTTTDSFRFLVDLPAATTEYTDSLPDSSLGSNIDLLENPPDTMQGLVSLPGGRAAAFNGREVLFSTPYKPWSWPSDYRETVDYDIVGLGVSGNDLYVLTKGLNYLITGYHPEDRLISLLPDPQSCTSKRSIVTFNGMVVYASPDGLVGLSGGRSTLITKAFYSREEWQAIDPTTLVSACQDNKYFGFAANESIIFQPNPNDSWTLTTTDQRAQATCSDIINDHLYLIQGRNLNIWDYEGDNGENTSYMTMQWRSKEFTGNRRVNWNSFRVVADGQAWLNLYADNVLQTTMNVLNDTSGRLPKIAPERTYSIEVVSASPVDSISIATSMKELI